MSDPVGPSGFPPPAGWQPTSYGSAPYGAAYPPWQAPVPQGAPGTVLAAAIITWIGAGLSVAMTLVMAVAGVFVGSLIISDFNGRDVAEIAIWFVIGAVVSLVFAGLACWFAWQTWRRQAWARYALAGMCVLTMAGSATAIASPLVVPFVAGAAVLILLFVPSTTAWFRQD